MLTAIWHAIRWTFRDPDGYITMLGGIWLLLKRHNCHVSHELIVADHLEASAPARKVQSQSAPAPRQRPGA